MVVVSNEDRVVVGPGLPSVLAYDRPNLSAYRVYSALYLDRVEENPVCSGYRENDRDKAN